MANIENLPLQVAFVRVIELAGAVGAPLPLSSLPNCWEHQVDADWWIAVNAHNGDRPAYSPQHVGHPMDVPAFSCHIEYRGWPAGVISPLAGVMAAGSGANEDTFIAAVEAAIATAKARQP